MGWNRRLNLYLDVDAPFGSVLIQSETATSPLPTPPTLYSGDVFPVRLHFLRRAAVPTDPATPADPSHEVDGDCVIVFSGKAPGSPAGETLFANENFEEIETGVWEGVINLNTDDLITHLDTPPVGPKIITGEVEISDTGNDQRYTLQFLLEARPQVWLGGPPPAALPTYPHPSALLLAENILTADIPEHAATVEIEVAPISALAATIVPLGVQRPPESTDNIGVLSAAAINDDNIRLYLTAAPSVEGYKVHVLIRP